MPHEGQRSIPAITTAPRVDLLNRLNRLAKRIVVTIALSYSCLVFAQGMIDTSTARQLVPESLADVASAGFQEYKLGAGDEVSVDVAGRPELSGPQVIGPDGDLSLPLVGSVSTDGLTRGQAATLITARLSTFYTDIFVTVKVLKYESNSILLFGSVEHPGPLLFAHPPTLLESLTRAGSNVGQDRRSRFPHRCLVYRGDGEVISVNLDKLLRSGPASTDIHLQKHDVVFVPEDQDHVISVIGEVKTPGPLVLTPTSNLLKVVAESGGLTAQAGDPTILILHPFTGKSQSVHFKDLLKSRLTLDVPLEDGDIIFVPRSGLAKTGFFLQQIAPLAQIGTLATFSTR